MEIRHAMKARPRYLRATDIRMYIRRSLYDRADERALIPQFATHRVLFGVVYQRLMPEFFGAPRQDSGVMISWNVETNRILRNQQHPGDIDLLVIPYEGDELVLSNTLAVEVKAVRATYTNPGRSPSGFGFSQARSLLECGFPFVAVLHLVVSDRSPPRAWRDALVTEIIDAKTGACGPLRHVRADMFPSDLLGRSFGRLCANCPDPHIGLAAAYVVPDSAVWTPEGSRAYPNPRASIDTANRVGDFFDSSFRTFLDTPLFPPAGVV